MKITVVAATSRDNSNTLVVAQEYCQILKELGHNPTLLSLADVPGDFIAHGLYNQKSSDPQWIHMQEVVFETEKFAFVIPEYNGSFPGILKVWVDGLKFPHSFRGKKAGLIGLSDGTQGAALAMGHFADIANYLGLNTLALRPRFIQIGKHIESGKITNSEYLDFLRLHAQQLVQF